MQLPHHAPHSDIAIKNNTIKTGNIEYREVDLQSETMHHRMRMWTPPTFQIHPSAMSVIYGLGNMLQDILQ
jgi:hypothetical protein